jgi:outer membrane protein assembly factor BamE (lipoprotein component of BamABCDE complex)
MSSWIRDRSAVLLVVFVASLLLAGCSGKSGGNSKVTKENAEKVKTGLSEKEVVDILGDPSEKKESDPKAKQFVWKDGNNSITAIFDEKGKVSQSYSQFVSVK